MKDRLRQQFKWTEPLVVMDKDSKLSKLLELKAKNDVYAIQKDWNRSEPYYQVGQKVYQVVA